MSGESKCGCGVEGCKCQHEGCIYCEYYGGDGTLRRCCQCAHPPKSKEASK